MSTFESDPVDLATLRAELAKVNVQAADLGHLLKVHGSEPLKEGLLAMSELRKRIVEILAPQLIQSERETVEQAFNVLRVHFAGVERVLRERNCACGELTDDERVEQTLEQALAEAHAARERVDKIERDYIEATDLQPRGSGKVINLGQRRKYPRLYVQTNGEHLRPSTAECFKGATDDRRDDGPEGGAA